MLSVYTRSMALWLLALACVSLTTVPASGRTLNAWDAWPTAARCPGLPTATSAKDGSGRLWGFADGGSCAFKDEQQQALYPNIVTPKQEWSTAPACGEAPTVFNSALDSVNRLWGVWWSKSCAFRTATGEPIYCTGYAGPKYSPPKPSPSPLPSPSPSLSPSPRPSPRPASPSPLPTPLPSLPASLPTPSQAPAAGGAPACTSQPTTIMLNATAVAEAVAAKLWEKFAYSTNGYEGNSLKASNFEEPTTQGTVPQPVASNPAMQLAVAILSILQPELAADGALQGAEQKVQAAQTAEQKVQATLTASSDTASLLAAEANNATTNSLLPVRPDGPNRTEDGNATQTRRHMLAFMTKQLGVAELKHPVQLQAPNGLQANSRHVLQESTSHNTTELEKAGVPEVAAVSPSLPEDANVTIYAAIQPPPTPKASTPANNTIINGSTLITDKPAATWENAPACLASPTANNTSKDGVGRLWGWESDASCAFKNAAGLPVFTFELAPVCKSVVATSTDEQGRLWGWEDGMSCKLLHIVNP